MTICVADIIVHIQHNLNQGGIISHSWMMINHIFIIMNEIRSTRWNRMIFRFYHVWWKKVQPNCTLVDSILIEMNQVQYGKSIEFTSGKILLVHNTFWIKLQFIFLSITIADSRFSYNNFLFIFVLGLFHSAVLYLAFYFHSNRIVYSYVSLFIVYRIKRKWSDPLLLILN